MYKYDMPHPGGGRRRPTSYQFCAVIACSANAQNETDRRHVAGGTLWAESTTRLSVSGSGPEPAKPSQSVPDDQAGSARGYENRLRLNSTTGVR